MALCSTYYFDPNYMLMNPTREILGRAALTKVFTQIPGIEYINIYSGDQPIVDARGNPVGMMCAADFVRKASATSMDLKNRNWFCILQMKMEKC